MSESSFGLDINSSSIKIAHISTDTKGETTASLYEECIANVKELDIARIAADKISSNAPLVASLDALDVTVRSLAISTTNNRDLMAAIPFQAEPLLPFPLNEAAIEHVVIEKKEKNTLVTLFATRKECVCRKISFLKNYAIEPDIISSIPDALACFATTFSSSPQQTSLIIHIDNTTTTCVLSKSGAVVSSRSFSIGSENFIHAIIRDESLPEAEARTFFYDSFLIMSIDKKKHSFCYAIAESFKNELTKTVLSLRTLHKEQMTSHIIVTGDFGENSDLPLFFAQKLDKKIDSLSYPSSLETYRNRVHRFALSIGLALSALPERKQNSINFRKGSFSHPHPYRLLKKHLITYALLSLILTASLFAFGKSILSRQEQQLRRSYISFVQDYAFPFDLFSIETQRETSDSNNKHIEKMKSEIDRSYHLPLSSLVSNLSSFNSAIQSLPDIYPLFPTVPRVSDFLAWLTTHPSISNENGSLLAIHTLSYKMVRKPDFAKKNEPYSVKIDMSFSTSTPRIAREFHQALLDDSRFINQKQDIAWHAGKDGYTVSFYLKSKMPGAFDL